MRMPGTITYLRFVFLVLIFFEAMVLPMYSGTEPL